MQISTVFLVIILYNTNTGLHASPVGDSLVNAELNGKELIKMGKILNKTLLTLLGETLVKMEYNIEKQLSKLVEKNLQDDINNLNKETLNERQELRWELCKLNTCTEWTGWSPCSASVLRTFGASTRMRSCGGNSSICPSRDAAKEETESKICQGTECRSNNYTKTTNNICIRLSKTVKKSWKDAQDDCHQDGGRLISIDSELKAEAIKETLQTISFTDDLWIDGTRMLPKGEWKYEYGPEDKTFSMWDTGEPQATDDCKPFIYVNGNWVWRGRECKSSYYFLCT